MPVITAPDPVIVTWECHVGHHVPVAPGTPAGWAILDCAGCYYGALVHVVVGVPQ